MKRAFVGALLGAFCLSQPALALPGWTAGKVRAWVKGHDFLAPNYADSGAGVTWYINGHRDIEGGGRVLVRYESGIDTRLGVYGHAAPPGTVFQQVRLSIAAGADDYTAKPGVWTRNSALARTLLEQIYGKEVAHDFAGSKFVYKGLDYYTEETAQSYRRERLTAVPAQTGELWDDGEVQFFQGKRFAYDVDAKRSVLMIFLLKDLPSEIAVMQHNQKIGAAYQQSEARKKPIKLNAGD